MDCALLQKIIEKKKPKNPAKKTKKKAKNTRLKFFSIKSKSLLPPAKKSGRSTRRAKKNKIKKMSYVCFSQSVLIFL